MKTSMYIESSDEYASHPRPTIHIHIMYSKEIAREINGVLAYCFVIESDI